MKSLRSRDFITLVKNSFKENGLVPVRRCFGRGKKACALRAAVLKEEKDFFDVNWMSNKNSIFRRAKDYFCYSKELMLGLCYGWDYPNASKKEINCIERSRDWLRGNELGKKCWEEVQKLW